MSLRRSFAPQGSQLSCAALHLRIREARAVYIQSYRRAICRLLVVSLMQQMPKRPLKSKEIQRDVEEPAGVERQFQRKDFEPS